MTRDDRDTDSIVKETMHKIQFAKIRKPLADQRVERCQWSRTGWAIVESDGCCTCQPAIAPAFSSKER